MNNMYLEYQKIADDYIDNMLYEAMIIDNDFFNIMTEGVGNFLKSAIETVLRAIEAGIAKIRSWFKISANEIQEREILSDFMTFVDNNPGLKSKNIKVNDLKKLNAAYDKAIANSKKIRDNPPSDASSLLDKIGDVLKSDLGAIGVTVATVGLVGMIKNNKDVAKVCDSLLNDNKSVISAMNNTIGTDGVSEIKDAATETVNQDKLKNKIKAGNFFTKLVMGKAAANKKEYNSLMSILGGMMRKDKAAMIAGMEYIADDKATKSEKMLIKAAAKGAKTYDRAKDAVDGVKGLTSKNKKE